MSDASGRPRNKSTSSCRSCGSRFPASRSCAFLLTVPFNSRFAELDVTERQLAIGMWDAWAGIVALGLSIVASVYLVAGVVLSGPTALLMVVVSGHRDQRPGVVLSLAFHRAPRPRS